jgi:hypothetical protein
MIDDLARLVALCPPARPLGLAESSMCIPPSHRALTDTYGTGCFDEFLWIYADGAENRHLDIASQTESVRSILREKKMPEIRTVLQTYGMTPEDLVQWGGTDNGDSLLWLPVGEPDQWPTIVIEAGQLSFTLLSGTSTAILLALLTRTATADAFPEDFPSDLPEFSANPYA